MCDTAWCEQQRVVEGCKQAVFLFRFMFWLLVLLILFHLTAKYALVGFVLSLCRILDWWRDITLLRRVLRVHHRGFHDAEILTDGRHGHTRDKVTLPPFFCVHWGFWQSYLARNGISVAHIFDREYWFLFRFIWAVSDWVVCDTMVCCIWHSRSFWFFNVVASIASNGHELGRNFALALCKWGWNTIAKDFLECDSTLCHCVLCLTLWLQDVESLNHRCWSDIAAPVVRVERWRLRWSRKLHYSSTNRRSCD